MRNSKMNKAQKIFSTIKGLPCFTLDDLSPIESNKTYLKILFSRYKKSNRIIPLKKGLYTTRDFVDALEKAQKISGYTEWIANKLSEPSYLSLDYILYEHHMLTEMPTNFTSITMNKTIEFSNPFGHFFYHSIKTTLFHGFEWIEKSEFSIAKATLAKALFDFLYLRKNQLVNSDSIDALRLNIDHFKSRDIRELDGYIKQEGTPRMRKIFNHLFL